MKYQLVVSSFLIFFKFVAAKKIAMNGQPGNFFRKLTKTYHLTVNSKSNFEEVYSTSVSKLKLYLYLLVIFLVSAAFITVLFFYSPLKFLVPGYPSNQLRSTMLHNSLMIDSLRHEIEIRDTFLLKIQKVLTGGVVEDFYEHEEMKNEDVTMSPMSDDSIFDNLIKADKYKFSYNTDENVLDEMTMLNLFSPVKGVVVNRFDALPGHYGVDIVGLENSYISSVLEGTVVFAEWSVSTGYVVQIQHDFNLISVYKHNSDIVVKSGDHVRAGELIAIMGNEGEYSTGPHLHFELWHNGAPVDPEEYISF